VSRKKNYRYGIFDGYFDRYRLFSGYLPKIRVPS